MHRQTELTEQINQLHFTLLDLPNEILQKILIENYEMRPTLSLVTKQCKALIDNFYQNNPYFILDAINNLPFGDVIHLMKYLRTLDPSYFHAVTQNLVVDSESSSKFFDQLLKIDIYDLECDQNSKLYRNNTARYVLGFYERQVSPENFTQNLIAYVDKICAGDQSVSQLLFRLICLLNPKSRLDVIKALYANDYDRYVKLKYEIEEGDGDNTYFVPQGDIWDRLLYTLLTKKQTRIDKDLLIKDTHAVSHLLSRDMWASLIFAACLAFPCYQYDVATAQNLLSTNRTAYFNLRGHQFTSDTLAGICLPYSNLYGTTFSSCHLENANLQGAFMKDALLSFVNMQGVNLSDADCENIQIQFSDISGVNCSGTILENAALDGTLTRTDFAGANMKLCHFKVNSSALMASFKNAQFFPDTMSSQDLETYLDHYHEIIFDSAPAPAVFTYSWLKPEQLKVLIAIERGLFKTIQKNPQEDVQIGLAKTALQHDLIKKLYQNTGSLFKRTNIFAKLVASLEFKQQRKYREDQRYHQLMQNPEAFKNRRLALIDEKRKRRNDGEIPQEDSSLKRRKC